ncbi:MAG: DNA translocase FtsK [Lactobacillus sp.]|jgi:S-DNA-T family DNA segregation ATPase FtsK/SpoIIIE|nr:DNA translocase FtsK [Lactobacillus sp.]
MTHYDGPAFYRKISDKPVTNTKRQARPKVSTVKASVAKSKPSVSSGRPGLDENFARSHIVTYKRAQNEQRYYQALLDEMQKPVCSYYLLGQPEQVVNQNSNTSTTSYAFETPTSLEETAPTANTSADLNAHHGGEDVNDASQTLAPDADSTPVSAKLADSPIETPQHPLVQEPDGSEDSEQPQQPTTVKSDNTESIAPDKKPAVAKESAAPTSRTEVTGVPATDSTGSPIAPELNQGPTDPSVEATPAAPMGMPTQPDADKPYVLPPLSLLPTSAKPQQAEMTDWADQQQQTLDETLQAFHVAGAVTKYTIGPTVTQFEVALERGVKVSKITNLNDDLRLALAAKDIRIEAPIPGRSTVGIEIPNLKSREVRLAEVLQSDAFQNSRSPLTIALGVNLFGQPVVGDIAKMPHALIAGSTGSGKSVFINSLLTSLMYKATPDEVKLILIDPKVVELAPYNGLPHLLAPVISDTREAAAALEWTVDEMEKRYQRFAAASVRNIGQFNQKALENHKPGLKMPYIVLIIDELADLMMTASNDVQDSIARITQKARAAGIHLIVATQRPSVDVVTGTIKNNIPTRIAFMVSSQIDSRTILDTGGAERLLGKGDMLYLGSGQNNPVRLQGTFINNEIDTVIDFVKQQQSSAYQFKASDLLKKSIAKSQEDDLMPEVLTYLAGEKTISTSKLQRMFSIGYNRAANIIDDLEAQNYIGQAQGSKPREVYFTPEDLKAKNITPAAGGPVLFQQPDSQK